MQQGSRNQWRVSKPKYGQKSNFVERKASKTRRNKKGEREITFKYTFALTTITIAVKERAPHST